jgi:hypothetical protein
VIRVLTARSIPDWLKKWDLASEFSAKNLLDECFYYPSSGLDGTPIRYFGGFCYSFVFVDYGYDEARILEEIKAPNTFGSGHVLIGYKKLNEMDLQGAYAWDPLKIDPLKDGDPLRYKDEIQPSFCFWAIYERKPDHDNRYGPQRFSFLYICAEAATLYQKLFYSNRVSPAALALISPGEGFGRNWANFFETDGILARSVKNNPSGLPQILVIGGNSSSAGSKKIVWDFFPRLFYFRRDRLTSGYELWVK